MSVEEGAARLFEKQLSQNELRRIIAESQLSLTQLMSRCGWLIMQSGVSWQSMGWFKLNYQGLIGVLNQKGDNSSINNYSLHFIHLLSYDLIQQCKLEQAKEMMKKALVYVDNTHTDPVLLTICLNNLALLHKRKRKYFKALRLTLKGMELMEEHIRKLKQTRNKNRIIEDAVILVSTISLCKSVLGFIVRENEGKIYRKIYEFTNYMGYRNCLKYLGRDSFLVKKFTPVEREFHLPIFRVEEAPPEEKKENENERLIIKQLENIYDVLKTKQNPEYIFVNTMSNISEGKGVEGSQSEQSIQVNAQITEVSLQSNRPPSNPKLPRMARQDSASIAGVHTAPTLLAPPSLKDIKELPRQQQPGEVSLATPGDEQQADGGGQQSEQQAVILAQQIVNFGKWQIRLRLQKQRGQQIGNLLLQGSNRRQSYHEMIVEEKLLKIIQQINVEDKLPYEVMNEELKEEEFLEYYIKPFMKVDLNNGRVSIHPKCMGLLSPFSVRFINQESFVFFNHVRHNLFRLSISPYYSSKSVYLNVQFASESMLQFFSFVQFTIDFVTAIYKTINSAQASSIPVKIKDKNKDCKVINETELLSYIRHIVGEFETLLLNREDETAVNEIIENELFYYKYTEVDVRKGKYYLVRYLPGIHCFDIYLQNNYQSYSIDGTIKARGSALYKSKEFLQDFGIPLSLAKNKLFAYVEIIAKKYELVTFDRPLSVNDGEHYIENAILQCPITQNCFKTRFFRKENYVIPITISLISVNSQIPVGIKIVSYCPLQSRSRGMFIHIVSQQWLRPFRRAVPSVNSVLFKTFISEFEFRRDYFLPEWLQKSGFERLFEKILDEESSLYLQENVNRFLRGTTLINIFNNEENV